MLLLTEQLRPLNLHLNGEKTEFISLTEHKNRQSSLQAEISAAKYNIKLGKRQYPIAERKLKKIWSFAISSKSFDSKLFKFCINRFEEIKSDFPLNDILENDFYDPSIMPEIHRYLITYIYLKDVQKVLLKVFNQSLYQIQCIWILKILTRADSLHFKLKELNKTCIYSEGNSMLIGYYYYLIIKFGDAGVREAIFNEYTKKFHNDILISRYLLLALLRYFPDKPKINKIFKLFPSLPTKRGVKYLK